jgi:hypothetical protein
MALSDALKKPIVPLLLEETNTWPPAGPMVMVFAEKLYIDFRRSHDNHGRWTGKEFELLLTRLKQAVPEVETENPQRYSLDMQRSTTVMKE